MSSGSWEARLRSARDRAVFGARLGLGVVVVLSAAVGAWLLALWSIGAWLVYVEEPVEPVVLQAALLPRLPQQYAFDDRPRAIDGAVSCPAIELGEYAGDGVQFVPAARVAAPFRERLVELERVLREVAVHFYGRAPNALLVAASYDCRPVTGNRSRLSEHALGNAIDITGFRFDATAGEAAFEVRVDRHWKAAGGELAERHERFLRALTQALIARDVFRTLLGPAHPDHHDHFHFDMAPHHYVEL